MLHKAIIYLFLIAISVFNVGCSSASKKLVGTDYSRGAYVKQSGDGKTLTKQEWLVSVNSSSVRVQQKRHYKERATKYYQKIENQRYQVTYGSDMSDFVGALVMTPIALVGDAFLALGILVGEFMPFTVMAWEDVFDTTTRYTSEQSVLPNEYITRATTDSFANTTAVASAKVDLYLNGKYQSSELTNSDGKLYFDSAELLLKSNIHPKNLIHNQGLKITASYRGVSDSVQISNSQIPDAYFKAKYQALRPEMTERVSKLENCESIASSHREVFECFYQSMY